MRARWPGANRSRSSSTACAIRRLEYHLTISGEPVFNQAGAFRATAGSVATSPKKNREQRLRLLSAIVGSTDDAIMSWSLDGILLTWNPARSHAGYSAERSWAKPVGVDATGNGDGDGSPAA
jgi:hypothetical protein